MAQRRHPRSGRFATKGQGGTLHISRRSLEKTIRTAANDIAVKARELLLEINKNVADYVQWTVEDEEACPICMELDEEIFPVGEGERPPKHINCRCFMVTIVRKVIIKKGKKVLAAESESVSTGGRMLTPEKLRILADEVSDKLGFDKSKIIISDKSGVMDIGVGGRRMTAAGAADLQRGTIEIFQRNVGANDVEGIIAHEITHQKFEYVKKLYDKEAVEITKLKLRTGSDMRAREKLMNYKGELQPPYDKQFPMYQKFRELFGYDVGKSNFAKDDGVTSYSKEYWAGYFKDEVYYPSAVHETLAEMSYTEYLTGNLPGTERWKKIYRDVLDIYAQRHRRSAAA